MIKTWQQRCEEHPDHEGIVTWQMIRDRMQEEIDELRKALEQPKKEWVGLTEAEIIEVVHAIEAWLKEKNGG